jgi:two-component system nitrogen regulation response regulator NtrX
MQQHRWKGNIRELRNAIERLLIMAPGDTIDERDLRGLLRIEPAAEAVTVEAPAAPRSAAPGEMPGTLREFKESTERAFLVQKLRENGWNISRTAEVIGTPRSNLYKKLEQYGIAQETEG